MSRIPAAADPGPDEATAVLEAAPDNGSGIPDVAAMPAPPEQLATAAAVEPIATELGASSGVSDARQLNPHDAPAGEPASPRAVAPPVNGSGPEADVGHEVVAGAAAMAILPRVTPEPAQEQPTDASADPGEDRQMRELRGRMADHSAAALMFSVVPVATIVGFSLLLTLTTAWMRGSAATGFELIGRSQNYDDALELGWPVIIATLPALLDGVTAALLGAVVLRWVESVPLARRRWRWAAAFFPLLVSMPVRAAGLSYFLGPGHPLPESELTTAAMTNLVWVSAAIPFAVMITAITTRWVTRRAAVVLAAALCTSWLALDIAAPALFARLVPLATLGPVMDTLMSLSGQLQLSAALVVMSVGVLGALLALAGWYALRFGRPAQRGTPAPVSPAGAALAAGSLVLAYLPIVATLLVGLWQGARPWRLCAPPSGCAPIITTAALLVPTTVAAGFLAACAYYAGWLNPNYRRVSVIVAMVSGFILPPTALGLSLWLTAVFFHLPRGLLTLFVGQTLVAAGLAFAAVHLSQLSTPPFELVVGRSIAVPPSLRRAGLYAGALGALYASGDFALANQLSGPVMTVPTSAFAEAMTFGNVGDEVLASLMWSVAMVPVFLFFLARLLPMVNPAASQLPDVPATPAAALVSPESPAST